ncbi:MAG: Nif3-like dinuclear metal center hexameric protein [Solobacterium sp.]|nr:Nif3-like dinuclear metal center hexameric protein [Solobacterium sp.]MBF1110173.1 Nif3-like dinuclear metal center hexameric protein [Solobacterium sp.]
MKVEEIIRKLKTEYHADSYFGTKIDESRTRDKVLYGAIDKECTGIVVTCFASTRVIREAHKMGCNFIISHEAMFWNHGDHTDWLQENEVFQEKKKLLDIYDMTVWRDHDYIHAGIPLRDGTYADGIFYGFIKEMQWERYVIGDYRRSRTFAFPGITAKELAKQMVDKMKLNGTRIIGDPDTIVRKAAIPMHLIGDADNHELAHCEKDKIDCLLTMEMTDYTVQEYIRDSSYVGVPRAIIAIGHFNIEEMGMKYMSRWLPEVVGEIPVHFIQSGDAYQYIV